MINILNFKLAEAYLLARALGDMSPSGLFRGCKGKEALLVFPNIFTGQEAVSWLSVGQSPQTKYSLFVYKKLVSDHQNQTETER